MSYFSLTINMRTAPGQQKLREWLDIIGTGNHQLSDSTSPKSQLNFLRIPFENCSHNLDAIINYCFPSALFDDPLKNSDLIAKNALLCPTNNDVQSINDYVLNRIQGSPVVYPSIDEPLETPNYNELNTMRSDFNLEAIHNEMPSGIPPHLLTLKVNFYKYLN